MDSPLLSAARGGRTHEGRSPGVATLKEAFDITYAVHRMEEEGARRRKYNGPGGAGVRGFLGGLNEDDEDEGEANEHTNDTSEDERSKIDSAGLAGVGAGRQRAHLNDMDGRAGQRDQGRGVNPAAQSRGRRARGGATKGFELDMDAATLLGRRNKRVIGSSPLAGASTGSPLRMEGLRVGEQDVLSEVS